MTGDRSVAFAQAQEALRQQRETFEQARIHANRWFHLRLAVGLASILMLPTILLVSARILLSDQPYPAELQAAAAGALFVDTVGVLLAVWKIVLNKDSQTPLTPTTMMPAPEPSERAFPGLAADVSSVKRLESEAGQPEAARQSLEIAPPGAVVD